LHFGDDAERSFGADEEAGEVVAGGGLAGASAGLDDASAGECDGHAQDVFADRAVTHGCRAGGSCGGHAAERGIGAGIDREHQAMLFEFAVELHARDASFDAAVEVVGVDFQDAVHARHVERDAAAHG